MFSSTLNQTSNGKPHFSDLNNTQLSSIGTPLDQSTPAFLFGKRKSSVPATFNNSPINVASAPSSDIFAFPTPSHPAQQVKDTSIGGSKTVHWSPSLVQADKSVASPSLQAQSIPSTTSFSHSSKPLAPSSFAGQAINAPPLRSLRDKIEPAKKVARRNTFAARSTGNPGSAPSTPRVSQLVSSSNEQQVESDDAADTWVTVFGFQPSQVSILLNLFARHGEIVSHQNPSKGNFVHVRYSCATHAHQAMSRNGTLLDSETLIGVVPCTNKDVINGTATGIVARSANLTSANRSMTMYSSFIEEEGADQSMNQPTTHNENVLNSSVLNSSHFDGNTSLNSSRLSVRSGVGMRPLAADQRANGLPQHGKQDSLFNKLWNTIGLN